MSQSILQFLINNISNKMLETATVENRYVREKCFKDLDVSEVTFGRFSPSEKSGLWGCHISSRSRRFKWPDRFVRTQKELYTKVDYYGTYLAKDSGKIYLIVAPGTVFEEGDLDLGICTIPKSMLTFALESKKPTIEVNNPYVMGSINVIYRQI